MTMLRWRTRRGFIRGAAALTAMAAIPGALAAERRDIRFGVTPAFLHDQHLLLERWRVYLTKRLGRKVVFVQRDSYQETMNLLRLNQLDFAWICDYPYLTLRHIVRLMAVPLYQGRPTYRSYLIVGSADGTTRGYPDLRGKIFAYADPYSNTGYLSPRFEIRRQGDDPAHYFRKTFFTWSHRKVIEAVAAGLANGGAVDSYVWDTLNKVEPELTAKTRIAWRSPEYGAPPLVASDATVSESDFTKMQALLMDMADDPEGRKILDGLNIGGFSVQNPAIYDSVAQMMRAFGEYSPR
ncbi:substrate-binding domain-containing protein [Varunaivibrio sulfuroxidans]|uniref:Phosphonate transport system substrate-binding protein n=1 Tax=Varunaivibrio sulfuroxidans TaxID=1773489 RepID=A0A4R3J6S6_9PROT|nr:PhnD/SsuA/transferrin family substrate-binding protein [Varunaivibrio sulfuroxidans]TCS60556.1 phosphonate transport system substrate-binding protein [Varunaivibrio sulfuroxidans]WES30046.1 PhnD/SsuA/transferrin family substrate-binding protein [Varunaivibrio sulfuroxidans]